MDLESVMPPRCLGGLCTGRINRYRWAGLMAGGRAVPYLPVRWGRGVFLLRPRVARQECGPGAAGASDAPSKAKNADFSVTAPDL